MTSLHRSLAPSIELDPKAAETKRSRLAAAGSLALRSKLPILSVAVMGITGFMLGGTALAAPTPVGLGTATDAAVVSGTQPTNTGVSTIAGDVSSSPNSQPQPGFLPCPAVPPVGSNCVVYTSGGPHIVDGVANGQRADTTAAFINASSASQGPTAVPTQLGGTTQTAGVYSFGHDSTANVVGTLTLDAQGNSGAVWIFQASSDLVTATGSVVTFLPSGLPTGVTAAQMACNVFWTVGSSATLKSGSTFVGTILAQTSIAVGDGVTVNGRLLAGTGDVTLIHDTIDRGSCAVLPAGTGGSSAGGSVATGGGPGGGAGGGAAVTASFAGPATPVVSLPKFTG
jgi:hypothetical protein